MSVTQRSEEPFPEGRLSRSHYLATHRHLFQDVYVWAGKVRTVRTGKEGNWFCYPENILGELDRVFRWLKDYHYLRALTPEEFAAGGAYFLSELNAIHAFREGNGRTQNAFFALLAAQAGHPIDFDKLDPEAFLEAMVHSFTSDNRLLEAQILDLIT
ncbi:Fic/DOC family protein [Caulobacter mirabilis]|uniref:Fic/DOC family protein n=1 Tax=Caulobacter mirabilis TaxID=69666 RepID=UPI001C0EF9E9|nr:Fic family protein [Caulobacter mirabilis]